MDGDGTWHWTPGADDAEPYVSTGPMCASTPACEPLKATTTSSTGTSTTTTPDLTTTTTTTTWTWTSTSTSSIIFEFPSLFCFSVFRTTGYEVDLIREQRTRNAGIFQCPDWAVFSNGEGDDVEIGEGYVAPRIPVPEVNKGDFNKGTTTDSWLNTKIFMKAWEMVGHDNRFRYHDWTVKVDPDAVFFPDRLRDVVRSLSSKKDGNRIFLANCNKYAKQGWSTFFGSLEVLSRQAVENYLWGWKGCEKKLEWEGWGEDLFVSQCMKFLGVTEEDRFDMLADKRCYAAPCSDTTKVVFHDYKDNSGYFNCWSTSNAAAAEEKRRAQQQGVTVQVYRQKLKEAQEAERRAKEEARREAERKTREALEAQAWAQEMAKRKADALQKQVLEVARRRREAASKAVSRASAGSDELAA